MAAYGSIVPSNKKRKTNFPDPSSSSSVNSPLPSPKPPTELTLLLRIFQIPSSLGEATLRIKRNFRYFGLIYAAIVLIGLSISLVPKRRVSLIILLAMTSLTSVFMFFTRASPLALLNRVIDRRLVLGLLVIVTVVALILTRAAVHLVVSLAIGLPLVTVHAVLRVRYDHFVDEEAAGGELVPLVGSSAGGVGSTAGDV